MQRYFNFPSEKSVCVLDILDNSQAATANIEAFRKHFDILDVVEITKSQYRRLQVQYGLIRN